MLRRLKISNYALIEQLDIELQSGFTVITGETGAGKSILLGALGLVLGNRADTTVLQDKENKCTVEANFDVAELQIKHFFEANDIDYDADTIIRREINPQGKSRAFINDCLVNLQQLKDLGRMLVDIHSQHDSLLLTDTDFQLGVIDSMADNSQLFTDYQSLFKQYRALKQELEILINEASEAKNQQDMLAFQFQELDQAKLNPDEIEELEQRINELSHAEDIQSALYQTAAQLNSSDQNVIQKIRESITALQKINKVFSAAEKLAGRMAESVIELKDIAEEAEKHMHAIYYDPLELAKKQERLSQITLLIKKYHCRDVQELIRKRDTIANQLGRIEKGSFEIENLGKKLAQTEHKLAEKAAQLTQSRKNKIPETERSVNLMLSQMGMPHAQFRASLLKTEHFTDSGMDRLAFLFSANKGIKPEEIAKVASGGELSRLMLAIKSLVSNKKLIPTIIFDEIDTGVSGEVAAKVGRIMATMSHNVQLIAISHLPQIAGKAQHHLFVFKREAEKRARTMLIQLNEKQRIDEIARMLSDDTITEASRLAAKELIARF